MWTLRAQWWKIAIIVVASLAVDIGLHFLWAPTPVYTYPVSYFVENGWFLPIVIVLLLITYIALALIFQLIQARLPGTKLTKGLTYGIAFGGLMFISSPAMSLLFGSPLKAELRIGLVDGSVIILLSILLGWFTATNASRRIRPVFTPAAVSMVVVGLVYFLFHFLVYLAWPSLFPSYLTRPTETLLWTLGVGLWIGLMNWLLQDTFATGSFVYQATVFAGVAFGIFSLLNTLFAPVFVAAPIGILLLNTVVGILFVGVGAWTERVVRQQFLHE
ncbi:MAG: hypothetical protein V1753_11105 [Pseudomonadota bacterium]